ncbi:MAG: DUF433 domain-containing protein [Myxococcota bacterium]
MDTELIVANPGVMLGKPVIRGTRITVEHVLERLAAGDSVDDLTHAYPRLTPESIRAALQFAASRMKSELVESTRPS